MKIDYLTNPFGIIKKFFIPYGDVSKQLYLEAKIEAITEEGYDEAEWFKIMVGYPPTNKEKRFSELSDHALYYQQLTKRSVNSLDEAVKRLKNWCNKEGLKIFEMVPACID